MFTPCEVAAGIDVGELRAEYGQEVLLAGGIDKRALAAGKPQIKAELEKRYRTAELGGYIPGIDHGVPPDVSWENYCYYVEVSKALCGMR
jgi:uroporphyrinogen decarboxylase